MSKKIVVIGGGIIGLSAAWRLAQKGHDVIVLEKNKCGSGATCASLGALIPYNPWRDDDMPNNQRQSLWSYATFAKELIEASGIDIGFSRLGRLQIAQDRKQFDRLQGGVAIAREKWPTFNGKPAQQMLTPAEIKQIEPEVEAGEFGALYCHATAMFEPARMIAALRAACMRNGVDVRENSPALEIISRNDGISSVKSATGIIQTSYVIMAAGAWSAQLIPKDYQQSEYVVPLKGQALELSMRHQPLQRLIRGLGIYLMPLPNNKIWLGATKERHAGFDNSITEEAEVLLLKKGETLMPALAEAKVVKHWANVRPHSKQGGPIVGWDKKLTGLYHATGHGGIGLCFAPYTAHKIQEDFSCLK